MIIISLRKYCYPLNTTTCTNMKLKFKVGDRVEITETVDRYGYKKGDKGTIIKLRSCEHDDFGVCCKICKGYKDIKWDHCRNRSESGCFGFDGYILKKTGPQTLRGLIE